MIPAVSDASLFSKLVFVACLRSERRESVKPLLTCVRLLSSEPAFSFQTFPSQQSVVVSELNTFTVFGRDRR